MMNEAVTGKTNETLQADFAAFVQRVYSLPEIIFAPVEKKEVTWSE